MTTRELVNIFTCATILQVFDHVAKLHGKRDCLGTREFLAEEDELQPNGKAIHFTVID